MLDADVKTSRREARRQAQRERILAAAQECFIQGGFHGASMAAIAKTAGMSPGLIYRYFKNKNAIILAIIDSQLAIARQRIREMRATDDMSQGIVDYFDAHDRVDHGSMNSALFLEIAAQATRDPEIGRAFTRFSRTVQDELIGWLKRGTESGGHGLVPETARGRALSLTLLIEGLKVRKVLEPDLDRTLLKESVDELLRALEL